MRLATAVAILCIAGILALATMPVGARDIDADGLSIRKVMRETWERPGAPLALEPVVVAGDFAIAGWIQDDRGGRALLKFKNGTWQVILCSGDHLKDAATTIAVGARPEIAKALVTKLLDVEKVMPREQRAKLSLFDGILNVEAAGAHGHHPSHLPR
jgi:hypothetical protein